MNVIHFKIQEHAVEWEYREEKENRKIMYAFSQKYS